MRRALDLHVYLGLIVLPYVVLLGVSAILLNHGIYGTVRTEWERRTEPLAEPNDDQRALHVWRSLGRSGRVAVPTVRRDSPDRIRFKAHRLGIQYEIEAFDDGRVRVVERNRGLIGVVRDLHGLRDLRGSKWLIGWSLYTEVTAVGVLLSIGSGAWMAMSRKATRRPALIAAGLGAGFGLLLFVMIW